MDNNFLFNQPLDVSTMYVGGSGMFLQFHDIVSPVYLSMILKMLICKTSYGLPIDILENFSFFSIIEWYLHRRYINPIQCLDYNHILSQEDADRLMYKILSEDDSIYSLSPPLNILKMMAVYKRQHMNFPVYVYTPTEEPMIPNILPSLLAGVSAKYVYGDLSQCISKNCDQNFTYIFSNIMMAENACNILKGTYSHILVATDYRYNYIDNFKTQKVDLLHIQNSIPFLRLGTQSVLQRDELLMSVVKNYNMIGG